MADNEDRNSNGDVADTDHTRDTVTSEKTGKKAARRFHAFDPMRQLESDPPPISADMPVSDDVADDEPDLPVSNIPKKDPVDDNWSTEMRRRRQGKTNARTEKHNTTETQKFYVYKAQKLLERYRTQHGIPDDVEMSYLGFVNWLLGVQPLYKRSTWRTYRNAVIYFLDGVTDPEARDAVARLQADNQHYTDNEKTGASNGQYKAKSLSYRNYCALLESARAKNSRGGPSECLPDFIEATIVTGLHPVEWSATEVVREPSDEDGRERIYLRVLSATTTNNRSHAIIRTLDITTVDETRRAAVERMSRIGAEWARAGAFHDRMAHMKCMFRKVCNNTPEFQTGAYQVTPYTLRHQFIANAKAQFSLIEIAALVGHNDVETAAKHYGRRGKSWGPDTCPAMPRPVPGEVALVKGRIQAYRNKVREIRINDGYEAGNDKVMRDTFGID